MSEETKVVRKKESPRERGVAKKVVVVGERRDQGLAKNEICAANRKKKMKEL